MTNQTKKSLAELLTKQGAGLGLNADSSATLIANLGATVSPMCLGTAFDDEEQEVDDFRLIFFGLDCSDSMEGVHDEVLNCFNEIVIPGLLGGAVDQVGSIRINGLSFGSRIRPLWDKGGQWQRLQKGTPLQLTDTHYPRHGGGTMLNQGVLDGVTAMTAYAGQIAKTTGSLPECVLVFMSDGANNGAPIDPTEIRKVLETLSPELFTLVFIGFETWDKPRGQNGQAVTFEEIARELGFRDVISSAKKPGESVDDMRRRLRHLMGVFSQQLVARTSTSQVGKASTPGTSQGTTGSNTTSGGANSGSGFWNN